MPLKLAPPFILVLAALAAPQGKGQDKEPGRSQSVPLTVPAGAPLRLYLNKRVSKLLDARVEATILTPVYSFDREVIPSGSTVLGRVSRLQPVPKWERLRAIFGGDFTPLHIAQIEFTSLRLQDGRQLNIHTAESPGLNTL